MPKDKINISLSPDTVDQVDRRSHVGRSPTINTALARYYDLCWRSRPDLSEPEWNLIRDACNGLWLSAYESSGAALSVRSIPHEVHDHIKLNRADAKWEVDGAELIKKLAALSHAELMAIADDVEVFWREARPGEESA